MVVLSHLGCGDHLLCNGLIRELSKTHDELILPVWGHNAVSVAWMYSDLSNVTVRPVISSDELSQFNAHDTLRLGCYDSDDYDERHFDMEFYRHAHLPFNLRWDGFAFPQSHNLVRWPTPFAFCHDDRCRGFGIPDERLPESLPTYRPSGSQNLFDYVWMLEQAEEIHVINSCFLILADSLPFITDRLYLHRYPRPTDYPTLRKKWMLIE